MQVGGQLLQYYQAGKLCPSQYSLIVLSFYPAMSKKLKLVRHTAAQLADAAPAPHSVATIYTLQSGKPSVRMESLMGTTSLITSKPSSAEENKTMSSPYDFVDYAQDYSVPIPDDTSTETETSKRKRTGGISPSKLFLFL